MRTRDYVSIFCLCLSTIIYIDVYYNTMYASVDDLYHDNYLRGSSPVGIIIYKYQKSHDSRARAPKSWSIQPCPKVILSWMQLPSAAILVPIQTKIKWRFDTVYLLRLHLGGWGSLVVLNVACIISIDLGQAREVAEIIYGAEVYR